MTLRSSDLQSDSGLDSIHNSCDFYNTMYRVFNPNWSVLLLKLRKTSNKTVIDPIDSAINHLLTKILHLIRDCLA